MHFQKKVVFKKTKQQQNKKTKEKNLFFDHYYIEY